MQAAHYPSSSSPHQVMQRGSSGVAACLWELQDWIVSPTCSNVHAPGIQRKVGGDDSCSRPFRERAALVSSCLELHHAKAKARK